MVSALEHYSYCARQCGLIHLESVFEENIFTIRGHRLHERVDEPTERFEKSKRVERAMPIWSEALGLQGKADVVEFDGSATPYPVEYKSGKPGRRRDAHIQLCAQALCLEEMLGRPVPKGALFYAGAKQRVEVEFTPELRERTVEIALSVREMLRSGVLPPPVNDRRCTNCSLADACQPGAVAAMGGRRPFAPVAERELP